MAIAERQLKERHEQELAGLDALETVVEQAPSLGTRAWAMLWPKLLAIGLVVGGWRRGVSGGSPSASSRRSSRVREALDGMGNAEFGPRSESQRRAVKGLRDGVSSRTSAGRSAFAHSERRVGR